MLILACLLLTATAALTTFAVTFGTRTWEIGDKTLVKTRFAVTGSRYTRAAWIGFAWRGPWRRRMPEPTTAGAICGRADRIPGCGYVQGDRAIGPFLVEVAEKNTIRALTDCAPRPQIDLSEQVDSDPWLIRLRIRFQPYLDAPWEADTRYVRVTALLPQARRFFIAVGTASAAYPLVALIRGPLWRRRRRRRGLCLTCGYNLTGNTSGRCPECGTLRERV